MDDEIIFGTMATPELRCAYERAQRCGVRHTYQLEPLAPQPGVAPLLTVRVQLERAVAQVLCHIQTPQPQTIALTPVRTEWDMLNWAYTQVWQGALPPQPAGTLVRYTIVAHPAGGGAPIPADAGASFSYLVGAAPAPAWAREAIVYQIFPDRFSPGGGRAWNPVTHLGDVYGGTLRGIIEKLDYVADLGFNCIWLNPFFPDHTHHGYHATDHFTVNPRMGTLADAQELVAQAHARGIRLLLDFVANHVGSGHPAFQSARAHRQSEFYSWFYWNEWPDEYVDYFGVRDLPQLNADDPAVRAYLLRSARFWLAEMGFDGLRLDYATGPSHDFWAALRAEVDACRPDAWIFGEVVEAPSIQRSYAGRLHGCLDFLLAHTLRRAFALGALLPTALDRFLEQHDAFFPPDFSRPSFLDNHDMDRFLWLCGGDTRRLKLAALCQFTLAGPPIVYNGAEIGVGQVNGKDEPGSAGMEECRQPMVWDIAQQDRDLHAFYKQLIAFRRAHPVLVDGARRTLHCDDATRTYAYTRSNAQETVRVALNWSDAPQTFTWPGAAQPLTLAPWSGAVDVIA